MQPVSREVVDFMKIYADQFTDFVVVDPRKLPCGHIVSAVHVWMQNRYNWRIVCSKIIGFNSDYSPIHCNRVCHASEVKLLSPEIVAYIKQFVDSHPSVPTFAGGYEVVTVKSMIRYYSVYSRITPPLNRVPVAAILELFGGFVISIVALLVIGGWGRSAR